MREKVHRRIGQIRNQSFIMQMRANRQGISQHCKTALESCLCLRCRLISEQLRMLRLLPSITNRQSRGRDRADRTGSTILKCSEINEIEASSCSRRKQGASRRPRGACRTKYRSQASTLPRINQALLLEGPCRLTSSSSSSTISSALSVLVH